MTAADTPWLTVAEAAAYARSSKDEILRCLRDESLRGSQIKANGKWRIHRDDVDCWLRGETPATVDAKFSRRAS